MEQDKIKLEKKKNRCFKSVMISATVTFLGIIGVCMGGYFIGKVPKPKIYQDYQETKRAFYYLDDVSKDLGRISDSNLSNTMQELNKMKGSLEENLKIMEENPRIKQYYDKIDNYSDLSIKYNIPLILSGIFSTFFSGALYHRYKGRLDALKKQGV